MQFSARRHSFGPQMHSFAKIVPAAWTFRGRDATPLRSGRYARSRAATMQRRSRRSVAPVVDLEREASGPDSRVVLDVAGDEHEAVMDGGRGDADVGETDRLPGAGEHAADLTREPARTFGERQ